MGFRFTLKNFSGSWILCHDDNSWIYTVILGLQFIYTSMCIWTMQVWCVHNWHACVLTQIILHMCSAYKCSVWQLSRHWSCMNVHVYTRVKWKYFVSTACCMCAWPSIKVSCTVTDCQMKDLVRDDSKSGDSKMLRSFGSLFSRSHGCMG